MKMCVEVVKTIRATRTQVREMKPGFVMGEPMEADLVEVCFTGGARFVTLGSLNPDGSARTRRFSSITVGERHHLMVLPFSGLVVDLSPENLMAAGPDIISAVSDLADRMN